MKLYRTGSKVNLRQFDTQEKSFLFKVVCSFMVDCFSFCAGNSIFFHFLADISGFRGRKLQHLKSAQNLENYGTV